MVLERLAALLLDFVGRFERLDGDFREVCRRIGLEAPALPRLIRTRRPDAATSYDDELRQMVAR